MQTYANSIETTKPFSMNNVMDSFVDYLFADKKSVYIESADLINGSYQVEYCHEYTLNNADPDWQVIAIPVGALSKFMVDNGLNKWEAVFVSEKTGVIENAKRSADAETLLLEMEPTERYDIIRKYLEGRAN